MRMASTISLHRRQAVARAEFECFSTLYQTFYGLLTLVCIFHYILKLLSSFHRLLYISGQNLVKSFGCYCVQDGS